MKPNYWIDGYDIEFNSICIWNKYAWKFDLDATKEKELIH